MDTSCKVKLFYQVHISYTHYLLPYQYHLFIDTSYVKNWKTLSKLFYIDLALIILNDEIIYISLIFIILHVSLKCSPDGCNPIQCSNFSFLLQDLGTFADNSFLSNQHLKNHTFQAKNYDYIYSRQLILCQCT